MMRNSDVTFDSFYMITHALSLIRLSQMKFLTFIVWTSPISILNIIDRYLKILIDHSVSKQWKLAEDYNNVAMLTSVQYFAHSLFYAWAIHL